jgi:nucleoside 2-deoxyribosyltransferase
MIRIVGGAYGEYCVEPFWNQLFGSGVRAAAALHELSTEVQLSTYIGSEDQVTLDSLAASFGFEVEAERIPRTLEFHYHHGLTLPRIIPHPLMLDPVNPLTVTAPNILRFGFIEGDAVVHGKRVVYDPQGGFRPRPFRGNGSTAEKLAVVANVAECAGLVASTTFSGLESLAVAVQKAEGADTVVMKCGPGGALVASDGQIKSAPSFRTDRVWAIGSGDVFTAVFAYYWSVENADALSAATAASLATAYYCQSRSLSIPRNFNAAFNPLTVTRGPGNFPIAPKQVYVASPFFTMAQRWLIEETIVALKEQGLRVFSPLHDIGYGPSEEVAPADLGALKKCDILFAIVDGLDSGTLFEVGYARAHNIPVVAFVQNEAANRLTMLDGSGCEITNDFVTAIYWTAWAAMAL